MEAASKAGWLLTARDGGDEIVCQAVAHATVEDKDGQDAGLCRCVATHGGAHRGIITVRYRWVGGYEHPEARGPTQEVDLEAVRLMGHRGAGAADGPEGRRARVLENTMLSFRHCWSAGKRGIEFDVHLSRDGTPVIYHDYLLALHDVDTTWPHVSVPLCRLSCQDFRELTSPASYERRRSKAGFDDWPPTGPRMKLRGRLTPALPRRRAPGEIISDAMPTLDEMFRQLPAQQAFDIEIKYPTLRERRKFALGGWPSRNRLVDATLDVVLSYVSQPRPVFFSSFDPDVCIMLMAKQTRFRVFYLNKGALSKDTSDPRRVSLQAAAAFAARHKLAGIIAYSNELLDNLDVIHFCKSKSLLLGAYGEINNSSSIVRQLYSLGVDIVISDSINSLYLLESST